MYFNKRQNKKHVFLSFTFLIIIAFRYNFEVGNSLSFLNLFVFNFEYLEFISLSDFGNYHLKNCLQCLKLEVLMNVDDCCTI